MTLAPGTYTLRPMPTNLRDGYELIPGSEQITLTVFQDGTLSMDAADIAFCQEVGIVGANGVHDFIDDIFKISIAAKTEKRKRVRVAESKHILWKFVENYAAGERAGVCE